MRREIIVHKTLAACMEAYGVPRRGYWKWQDADGHEYRMSREEAIKRHRKSGGWAWIADKKTIHVWLGWNCTRREAFRMLAHEMGHAERPFHRSLAEERKAAKYERVALSAFDHLEKVWRLRTSTRRIDQGWPASI